MLFCKTISPPSHQWCLSINKDSKKGSRKDVRRGYPNAQVWPDKAAFLWSQGLRSSKMIRSMDQDKIASWAILRWESVPQWNDLRCATTQLQFSTAFNHHLQPDIRAGFSIPACYWKHFAFMQHSKQGYRGEWGYFRKNKSSLKSLQDTTEDTQMVLFPIPTRGYKLSAGTALHHVVVIRVGQ